MAAVQIALAPHPSSDVTLHPATDEFLARFAAMREQLENDHPTAAEHAKWEAAVEALESALRNLRELIAADVRN